MFLFARQRQIIRLPIYLQESFASTMSYSLLHSCNRHEKRFFHLFLESLCCKVVLLL